MNSERRRNPQQHMEAEPPLALFRLADTNGVRVQSLGVRLEKNALKNVIPMALL